ncbi:TetR/AcrR family transcriptional regulator [Amycolatopsis benzoatilytica]|uniref:TetR/AcrR family transcriptional regulator n=1 Tax=Amycolatopsis benzoatilytica TaxID=346045 RepID=UPI000366BA15|nr:TetR/AcrR family transcriptional regulator [Amycolatopsis benzoatilytica]
MPKVSEQHKEDRRAEILAAARRCFVRNGFHRTSMQDVFAEAGLSAGAVYRYFPKKEDLIVGVAAQNLDRVAGVLRSVLSETENERRVGAVLAKLLEAVLDQHRDNQLATIAVVVWSEALRDRALAEQLEAAARTMTGDLAALVRDRQQAGSWTGAPAGDLAQVLLSILPGFLFNLALLGPSGVAGFPDAVRALWPE